MAKANPVEAVINEAAEEVEKMRLDSSLTDLRKRKMVEDFEKSHAKTQMREKLFDEWLATLDNYKQHKVGETHLVLQAGDLDVETATDEQLKSYKHLRSYELYYHEEMPYLYDLYMEKVHHLTDEEMFSTWMQLKKEITMNIENPPPTEMPVRRWRQRCILEKAVRSGTITREEATDLGEQFQAVLNKEESYKVCKRAFKNIKLFEEANLERMPAIWSIQESKAKGEISRVLTDFSVKYE